MSQDLEVWRNALFLWGEAQRRAGRPCRIRHQGQECVARFPEELHRWCDRCLYKALLEMR